MKGETRAFIPHPSSFILVFMGSFTGLILILLFFAFLLRVDFIFYIAYVCIGMMAWSRWMTPRQLKKIRVSREYSPNAFWGEKVPIELRLENKSRLTMPWLHLSESLPLELRTNESMNQVLSLHGRETAVYSYHIQSHRRGYYQIGPLRLATSDLFGFMPEQFGQVPVSHITIYPRIIPLVRLGLPSRLPFGTVSSQQRLFADPARPMGIRQFRSGDSMRQIHWKASAHTRQLVVKTFEPAISLETAVLLNLHTPDYTPKQRRYSVEWGIELAASLAAHLIEQRQPVGLFSNGIDPLASGGDALFDEENGRLLKQKSTAATPSLPPNIMPRTGRPHLMKLLQRLARIETESTVSFTQWAMPTCAHLSWGVTLLVITPHGDLATCQTVHQLVRKGFNPVLITIEPDHNFSEVRQRARHLGFLAFNMCQTKDLASWQQMTNDQGQGTSQ